MFENHIPLGSVEKAAKLAHDSCGCKYAGISYGWHLEKVCKVALDFLYVFGNPSESALTSEEDVNIISACLCHDLMEDCRYSYSDLIRLIGKKAADIVYRVTDELGKSRSEKALRTYPKIAECRYATFVKLCDRIANVEATIGTLNGPNRELIGIPMYNNYMAQRELFDVIIGKRSYGDLFNPMFDRLNTAYAKAKLEIEHEKGS